jgi:hypothetical protein
LLLAQSKALDKAPYKLSGAVAKLAGITFWSLAFSYWFDKPRFLAEGRLATVLIISSSWGSQLGGYLPASRFSSEFGEREYVGFVPNTHFSLLIATVLPSASTTPMSDHWPYTSDHWP